MQFTFCNIYSPDIIEGAGHRKRVNIMFKYETHLHINETSPCGRVTAEEAVRINRKAGYTGLVVTDHYFNGFLKDIHS